VRRPVAFAALFFRHASFADTPKRCAAMRRRATDILRAAALMPVQR
jgi:hypothetical protein